MDDDEDFAMALQLSQQLNEDFQVVSADEVAKQKIEKPLSIVDRGWELIDPVPDIRELFVQFNAEYFDGLLAGVEVKWSSRMTLCAGVCCYEGRGGLCSVKLSEPLLKLRPRSDLVNTLLHEMIHALLFVTDNNKDHDGHGAEFHKHMYRINKRTGSNITVYHTFHDEVNNYRQHWWRCDGPCVKRPPFYGIVRRAMNRAPAARDPWFKDHQAKCGGTFIKIKEPEKSLKKKKEKTAEGTNKKSTSIPNAKSESKRITDWFSKTKNIADGDLKVSSNHSKSSINDQLKNDTFWSSKSVGSNVKNFQSQDDSSGTSVYAGSSSSSSSNLHGFKMTANNKSEIAAFAGKGFKMGDANRVSSRNVFLEKIEANIVVNTKRKCTDNDSGNVTKENDALRSITNHNVSHSNKRAKLVKNENTDECYVESSKNLNNLSKKTNNAGANILNGVRVPSTVPVTDRTSTGSSSSIKQVKRSNSSSNEDIHPKTNPIVRETSNLIILDDSTDENIHELDNRLLVECPACPAKVPEYELNQHLDKCLA